MFPLYIILMFLTLYNQATPIPKMKNSNLTILRKYSYNYSWMKRPIPLHLEAEIMKICSLILLLLFTATQSQQIFLTGKVMDATGKALQGATVTLCKIKRSAVSDVNGVYQINGSPVLHPSLSSLPIKGCEIIGGVLHLTFNAATHAYVAAYDMQGRLNSVITKGLLPAGNHTFPLEPALPKQVGILSVTIGNNRTLFRLVNVDHLNALSFKATSGAIKNNLAKTSAVAILDTLRATSGANSVKLFVYTYVDSLDFWIGGTDPYTEYRQQCIHRINYYRSLVGKGRFIRNLAKEACVDSQCQSDAASGAAHGAFGKCGESAQDECPGWGSLISIVTGCLQQMWDEGAPPAGTCTGACYQQHGHYINMTGAYTRAACGFYVNGSKVQAVQNFWR
jgi:hypothetical protein